MSAATTAETAAAAAEPAQAPPPLGAASLAAAIALGDCDALLKILDSGALAWLEVLVSDASDGVHTVSEGA